MTRALLRIALPSAALALLLPSPALAARGFSHGVTAGEVTSSSAKLWGKANRSGTYRLQVSERRRFGHPAVERRVRALRRNDNTVQAELEKRLMALDGLMARHIRYVRDSTTKNLGSRVFCAR